MVPKETTVTGHVPPEHALGGSIPHDDRFWPEDVHNLTMEGYADEALQESLAAAEAQQMMSVRAHDMSLQEAQQKEEHPNPLEYRRDDAVHGSGR